MYTSFQSIVISGGAFKLISAIGCIKYLEEENLTKNIINYIGTSAGSIICLYMILGYKWNEIVDVISKDLNDDSIMTCSDIDQVLNVLNTFGLSDGANIIRLVEKIIYRKLKVKDLTFIDLAKSLGKNFVVGVSNITKQQEEYFCVDTTPNMKISLAIRTSCSLPFLFTPISFNSSLYVDGSMYNNFPIKYIKRTDLKDIIGINIISTKKQSVNDFSSYFMILLYSILDKLTYLNLSEQDKKDNNILSIDVEDIEWFSLIDMKCNFPQEQIYKYIESGYSKMKEQLLKNDLRVDEVS